MTTTTDRPFPEIEGATSIGRAVSLAIGAASTCWSNLSSAGDFEVNRAVQVSEALMSRLARPNDLAPVLREVAAERERQTAKHGNQDHLPGGTGPDVRWLQGMPRHLLAVVLADEFRSRTKAHSQNEGGNGTITFLDILLEEVAEAFAEDDPAKLRAELVQVAAVAVQWIEAIDRRAAKESWERSTPRYSWTSSPGPATSPPPAGA